MMFRALNKVLQDSVPVSTTLYGISLICVSALSTAFFTYHATDDMTVSVCIGLFCFFALFYLRMEIYEGVFKQQNIKRKIVLISGINALLALLSVTLAINHFEPFLAPVRENYVQKAFQHTSQGIQHATEELVALSNLEDLPTTQDGKTRKSYFRRALVIGTSAYRHPEIVQLPNAKSDAQKLSLTLKRMGYQTTMLQNPTLNDLVNGLAQYKATINPFTDSLIVYAGHGFSQSGSYYVLPTDYKPGQLETALDLSVAIESIASKRPNNSVVIIDACRTPFNMTQTGTDRTSVEIGHPNTYIAMATAPNTEAYDGPPGEGSVFSEALLRNIQREIDIDELFRSVRNETLQKAARLGVTQVPWSSNNLLGRFSLASGSGYSQDADNSVNDSPKASSYSPTKVQTIKLRLDELHRRLNTAPKEIEVFSNIIPYYVSSTMLHAQTFYWAVAIAALILTSDLIVVFVFAYLPIGIRWGMRLRHTEKMAIDELGLHKKTLNTLPVFSQKMSSVMSFEGMKAFLQEAEAIHDGCPQSARGHAIIIGNGQYHGEFNRLVAPELDATEVEEVFRRLGYRTSKYLNATAHEMRAFLSQCSIDNKDAETTVFYYSGHGLSNGIVGVDGNTLMLSEIVEFLQTESPNIYILDSCRACTETTSIETSIERCNYTNSFWAFSCINNSLSYDGTSAGKHSLFTQALLRHLETPDLSCEQLIKKVRTETQKEANKMGIDQVAVTLNTLTEDVFIAGKLNV